MTVEQLSDLAFLKALKCPVGNIPLGDARGGVMVHQKELSRDEPGKLTRSSIREIADFIGPYKDIPAPDRYTDESTVVWILDECEHLKRKHVPAVVTEKPYELGGIPAVNYST